MPRTRMDELFALAEEHDGLLTSKEARAAGIQDSVLVRLAQRGRLERMTRGVYRISHYPANRLAQYREAVLWAKASQGPEHIALSRDGVAPLWRLRREPIACESYGSHFGKAASEVPGMGSRP
jgi:hypothetical protein